MRIAPIFVQPKRINSTAMGRGFQRTNCRKPHTFGNFGSYDSSDLFIRMAQASLRDKKIELELTSMELI